MRVIAVSLLVSALAVATVFAVLVVFDEAVTQPTEVVILTDENFKAVTQEYDTLLVEFYAPWCGHCKQLAPKYDEASLTLAKHGHKIAKYDADKNKMVAGEHGVKSFPTLKLFRNGVFTEEYDGERTTEGIVNYVIKKAATAINQEVTSLAELKTLVKAKNVDYPTVVGFFGNKDGVDFKYFKSVVSFLSGTDVKVYHASSPEVLEGFGFYSAGSSIQMYHPVGKPFKVIFRGTIFKDALKSWIIKQALSGITHYTPANHKLYALHGKAVLRIAVTAESGRSDAKRILTPLSMDPAYVTMLFATALIEDYAAEVDEQCGSRNVPCVLVSEASGRRLFGLSAPANTADVQDFLDKFITKKLVPKVKVEPEAKLIPGEVAVLVESTFTRDVIDSDQNVLIKFYAPWCGHCKALAPKIDALAKELSAVDDVVIAKFDMTANNVPKEYRQLYEVQGFPTLYFAPRGEKKKPVKYDGARETDAMKKWVLKMKK